MNFANPRMFWILLAVVPLLSGFFWWSWRKRKSLIAQFIQSRLLAQLSVGPSARLQMIRIVLAVVVVVLLIVALARPQLGFESEEAVYEGLDVIVAIDTSRSMLANDIAPNRLARAKFAVIDLQRIAKKARLGLVAFAGTAFLQCPLTTDQDAFRQSLQAVEIGVIPQGGTAIIEALKVSKNAFGHDPDTEKAVVLITDGEDHEPGAVEAARLAAQSGIRIFTVGVGTANGELLPLLGENGERTYVKDSEGNVVKSRLNELLLTQIAQAARGFYLLLNAQNSVETLYGHGLATLPKHQISSKMLNQSQERFQWLVALAVVLLVLEIFLLESSQGRAQRSATVQPSNATLLKPLTILILFIVAGSTNASPRSALRDYRQGRYQQAQQTFEKLLAQKREDFTLSYNAGTAAYQAGNFGQAIRHFSLSITAPDLTLQQRSYYNLGNSFYRLGESVPDFVRRRAAWGEALKTFESSLKLDSSDADAQSNVEFIKKRIRDIEEQAAVSESSKTPPKTSNPKAGGEQKQDSAQGKKENTSGEPQETPDNLLPPKKPGMDARPDGVSSPSESPGKPGKSEAGDSADAASRSEHQREGDASASAIGDFGQSAMEASRMTLDQAKRLLDGQKAKEKAMLFAPDESRTRQRNKILKDW